MALRLLENFSDPLRRRKVWARFKRGLTRHTGLRVLSLMLAIALWLFVNTGQHQSEIQLRVPVNYNALPPGLVVVNHHAQFVKLDVVGPRTLLSLLEPGRLALRLDLGGVNPGQASFRISPEMFNVPRQTSITRIVPSQIVLDIDRLLSVDLPIKLITEGKVATGYEIASITLKPPQVEVTGPSRFVSYLRRINTQPLSVQGATADITAPVRLVDPGPHDKLSLDIADAHVSLRQVITSREFKGLKVQVRDTDRKVEVDPKEASITVRGPLLQLSKLDLGKSVFVNADGAEPGWHELPVEVDLPAGVELMNQTPRKVKLKVFREKRSSSG